MNPYNLSGDSGNPRAMILGAIDPENPGPGPFVMASDTLEDNPVIGPGGDKLGTVNHIMLDVVNGRVAYAVLCFGGFLGFAEKLFAVPWSALTLDTERKSFVLGIDKATLEAAPGFDKDHWPSMADPQWGANIHAYYGRSPYWKDYRYEREAHP